MCEAVVAGERVTARRRTIEITECRQRLEQPAASFANLDEKPVSLLRGGRLIRRHVQPERQFRLRTGRGGTWLDESRRLSLELEPIGGPRRRIIAIDSTISC
jgi:hypothetical protein